MSIKDEILKRTQDYVCEHNWILINQREFTKEYKCSYCGRKKIESRTNKSIEAEE